MYNVAELDVLGEVLRLIESTLKVPADQVDIDANLESFGVNSLIVMELMENIEKEFEVTLTPAQFANIDTVRGIAGLLETLLEEPSAETPPPPAAVSDARAAPVLPAQASPTPAAMQPLRSRHADGPTQPVLDYVSRTFAVNLSGREFDSIEDIADALVSHHAADLMRYYGLTPQSTLAGQAVAPVRAPLVAMVVF